MHFFERYSFIKHSFQLELHSKSLFHKLIAISRYETNFDTPAKSHFLRILEQKWHVTQWRWHIWQMVQNPKIVNKTAQWRDLSNKGACKSFHMQFAKVGEQKGLLGREMYIWKMEKKRNVESCLIQLLWQTQHNRDCTQDSGKENRKILGLLLGVHYVVGRCK